MQCFSLSSRAQSSSAVVRYRMEHNLPQLLEPRMPGQNVLLAEIQVPGINWILQQQDGLRTADAPINRLIEAVSWPPGNAPQFLRCLSQDTSPSLVSRLSAGMATRQWQPPGAGPLALGNLACSAGSHSSIVSCTPWVVHGDRNAPRQPLKISVAPRFPGRHTTHRLGPGDGMSNV